MSGTHGRGNVPMSATHGCTISSWSVLTISPVLCHSWVPWLVGSKWAALPCARQMPRLCQLLEPVQHMLKCASSIAYNNTHIMYERLLIRERWTETLCLSMFETITFVFAFAALCALAPISDVVDVSTGGFPLSLLGASRYVRNICGGSANNFTYMWADAKRFMHVETSQIWRSLRVTFPLRSRCLCVLPLMVHSPPLRLVAPNRAFGHKSAFLLNKCLFVLWKILDLDAKSRIWMSTSRIWMSKSRKYTHMHLKTHANALTSSKIPLIH